MLTPNHASIVRQQKNFGYSEEDLRLIIRHMAQVSEEPIGSMGSDSTVPDALETPATALRLLHSTLRPGHQPATRRHPRGARHVDARHHRRRGQPAHREREPLPPDRPAVTDPQHRRTREDPLHRGVRAYERLHDGRHRRALRGPRCRHWRRATGFGPRYDCATKSSPRCAPARTSSSSRTATRPPNWPPSRVCSWPRPCTTASSTSTCAPARR